MALPGVGQASPIYNNLAYDSKTAQVPDGVIPNGSTSVTASFDTNGDAYQLGAFVFTARIQPLADLTKNVSRNGQDVNHGEVAAGGRFTFTIGMANIGDLDWTAGTLTDVVPDGLTPVAGTLTLDGVPLTDAADSDAGELAGKTYTVDVGALQPNRHRTITFDVTVDDTLPDRIIIVNRAQLDYRIGANAFHSNAQTDVTVRWIDPAPPAPPTIEPMPGYRCRCDVAHRLGGSADPRLRDPDEL